MYAPTAASGGIIYVMGASDYSGGTVIDTQNTFSFNPAANTIGSVAQIPRAVGETRALVVGGDIWVMGGGRVAPNPSTEVDVYHIGSNTWTLGPPFTTARRNFSVDTNGSTIWLAGGYDSSGTTALGSMEIYTSGSACGSPTPTVPASPTSPVSPTATVCVPMAFVVGPNNPGKPALINNGKGSSKLGASNAKSTGSSGNKSINPANPNDPVTFVLDDGAQETSIGFNNGTSNYPAIWINRFSPPSGSYPINLNQISIQFPGPASAGRDITGLAVDLLVYLDTDGNNDPSNATKLAQIPATITVADGTTFSNYSVNINVPGPGDVYIGFADTYNSGGVSPVSYPGPLDTTQSQSRSWVAGMSASADPDYDNLANDDVLGTRDSFG
jgi:hypothetical protein